MPGPGYLEIDRTPVPVRPPQNFLDDVLRNQEQRKPRPTDAYPLLSRILFVPFRDRRLTIKQMDDLGLPMLKAGWLLPVTKFSQQIYDYAAMTKVPMNPDGTYQPSEFGVHETKRNERAPGPVIEAIFRIFNAHHGTGLEADNGICEIEALRGNEDWTLLRRLQTFCLPASYSTAREQLVRLRAAQKDSPDSLCSAVIERLIVSTETSVTWGHWHYENLRAQMKDWESSGKKRLSPLNHAVCKWIEQPVPELRGQLADEMQRVTVAGAVPVAVPQTQCLNCGTFVNLINGNPPKLCFVCQNPFGEEDEEMSAVLKCGEFGGETKAGNPCKNPAGHGTDHVGEGRCELHPEE